MPGLGDDRLAEFRKKEADELVAHAVEALGAAGYATEKAIRVGDPGALIVEEASAWPADLIVLGSRGLGGYARLPTRDHWRISPA